MVLILAILFFKHYARRCIRLKILEVKLCVGVSRIMCKRQTCDDDVFQFVLDIPMAYPSGPRYFLADFLNQ